MRPFSLLYAKTGTVQYCTKQRPSAGLTVDKIASKQWMCFVIEISAVKKRPFLATMSWRKKKLARKNRGCWMKTHGSFIPQKREYRKEKGKRIELWYLHTYIHICAFICTFIHKYIHTTYIYMPCASLAEFLTEPSRSPTHIPTPYSLLPTPYFPAPNTSYPTSRPFHPSTLSSFHPVLSAHLHICIITVQYKPRASELERVESSRERNASRMQGIAGIAGIAGKL